MLKQDWREVKKKKKQDAEGEKKEETEKSKIWNL